MNIKRCYVIGLKRISKISEINAFISEINAFISEIISKEIENKIFLTPK